jgi:hypothetical protein
VPLAAVFCSHPFGSDLTSVDAFVEAGAKKDTVCGTESFAVLTLTASPGLVLDKGGGTFGCTHDVRFFE